MLREGLLTLGARDRCDPTQNWALKWGSTRTLTQSARPQPAFSKPRSRKKWGPPEEKVHPGLRTLGSARCATLSPRLSLSRGLLPQRTLPI